MLNRPARPANPRGFDLAARIRNQFAEAAARQSTLEARVLVVPQSRTQIVFVSR